MNSKTIFISISCMDDEEITYTVNSIFENANHPQNVFVGIGLTAMKSKTLSLVKKISKKYSNVRFSFTKQKKNNIATLGVGLGRLKAQQLYKGEDYFMQVDAHSYFEKGWDDYILDLFQEAVEKVGDEKVVLTCIPPRYVYSGKKQERLDSGVRYPQFVDGFFVDVVPMWISQDSLQASSENIIPSSKANSAFLFGNKKFAKNTGIVSSSIFYDEEILYSINLFGDGFALAFPNVSDFPIMHLDGDAEIEGHNRFFFLDYLDQNHSKEIHEKLRKNYTSFVSDPKNKDKIEKYKQYAKIDPKLGYFSSQGGSIPKNFR
jgi:hypothetical protein